MDFDIAEGYFWYGHGFVDNVKGFPFYKEASDRDLPTGQYQLGYCFFYGYGTERNKFEAQRLIKLSGEGEDSYYSRRVSMLFSHPNNTYDFPIDLNESKRFENIASENIDSDCSVFFHFF